MINAHRIALLTSALLIVLGGCNTPKMKRFDTVRITVDHLVVDSAGQVPTFDVDLVGIRPENPNDQALLNQPVDDYFKGIVREELLSTRQAHRLRFTRGSSREVVLTADDLPWAVWDEMGIRQLMVIDDLHGALARLGQVGPPDRRRQVIPLDRDRWTRSDTTLEVIIRRSGIDFAPAPQPPKN